MVKGATKNILLRLEPELAERLRMIAEVEGRSVTDVAREAIAALVEGRRSDEQFSRLLEDNLDLYDVLAVAAEVWRVDALTAIRRTDLEEVDRALAIGRLADDLPEELALLLEAFVCDRPFDGGNRLVSMAVLLQLAALNGRDLELEPVDQLDDLLDRIRDGRVARSEVVDQLSSRLGSREVTLSVDGPDDISTDDCEGEVMFERFSERARRVMVLAQEEARELAHDYIGTEHILLAILHEGDGAAAKVLANSNISRTAALATSLEIVGRGTGTPGGHVPFTPRAKRVLEYSLREAMGLGHVTIGTEHLLLGIIRDGEGVATQVLVKLGADLPKLRTQLISWLEQRQRAQSAVSEFLADDAEPSSGFKMAMPGRKRHLLMELKNLFDENDRLYAEISRLREKLRRHDLDPDD
jgi:hypothetical protein